MYPLIMLKNRIFFLLIFLLVQNLVISNGFTYVLSRNKNGDKIQWGTNNPNIKLYFNTNNSSGLDSENLKTILNNSINEWSNKAKVSLSSYSAFDTAVNRNDVYFTKSSSIGTGVLAVTSVSFDSSSGKLIEADIKINDSVIFNTTLGSSDSNEDKYYIGDVFTHEIGHLLGLSHGQTFGSSMIYTVFKNQNYVHTDDIAGLNELYPLNSTTYGTISGKVVGSNSLIGVFGTYVQAISAKTGKVVGGGISEESGSFSIYGLPLDDTYYLYVIPRRKNASLPVYFSTAQDNFCVGGDYKESFFTKCSFFDEGFPEGINLNSSEKNINVGNVSIKCGLNTNQDYLDKKADQYSFEIPMYESKDKKTVGNAMVGYFSSTDIILGQKDSFYIDLRDLTNNSLYTQLDLNQQNLYLEIKFLSQYLFSNVKAKIVVSNYEDGGTVNETYEASSDNNLNFNFRVKLDSTSSKNYFKIKIYPQTISDNSTYFPNFDVFKTSVPLYFLIANISQKSGSQYNIDYMRNYKQYEDNTSCPDASKTFSVGAYTYYTASDEKKVNDKKNVLGIGPTCGSIDLNGGNGGGGNSGLLILSNILLGFLLSSLLRQYYMKKVGENLKTKIS